MTTRQYRYHTCDVFTDTRFGGNPLAVVPEAAGLSAGQMQTIAAEFNYSETTFVLPAEANGTHRLRIFTRKTELPFAGHPNIGTAFVLTTLEPGIGHGANGPVDLPARLAFEQPAGLVEIEVSAGTGSGPVFELKAPAALTRGDTISASRAAGLLGLEASVVRTDHHEAGEASVGKPFMVIELAHRSALEQARPDLAALESLAADDLCTAVLPYVRNADGTQTHQRMFAPLGGTFEDPATGSAACALAGLLADTAEQADGELAWRMHQGMEMGRPSLLAARARKSGGAVAGVWLAGQSVAVASGEIRV